jgi:hypothetical protein
MALSDYEERVLAELETQFHAGDAPETPGPNPARLALAAACFLGGVALLVAAQHVGLVISISDFWGFATSSVTSTLGLAGYTMLLGSAFFLGGEFSQLTRSRRSRAEAPTPFLRTERVQSP